MFSSCKNEKKEELTNNFNIKINISGAEKNTKVFLKKQKDGISIKLDSTEIKNEKAEFIGNINSPEVYGIFIEGISQGVFPIIEKGTIKVNINTNDMLSNKIYGSPLNKQLNDFKNEARSIAAKMNNLFHEFQKARAENNSKKLNEINKKMEVINNELTKYKIDFVTNNSDSFVASMVLFSLANENLISKETTQMLYNKLSEEVKKSEFSINTKKILNSSINN